MKKRIFCFMISLQFFLCTINIYAGVRENWTENGNYSIGWYTNNSENDNYIIESAKDLAGFCVIVNGLNNVASDSFFEKHIYIKCDLDLSRFNWTPIGTSQNPFCGIIDASKLDSVGNYEENHVIKNLSILSNTDNCSLFGYNKGTIKNITTDNCIINCQKNAGIICGENVGTIMNCVAGGEVNGTQYVGGICGKSDSGEIFNCVNEANIFATDKYSGGICGYIGKSCSVSCCQNYSCVSSEADYIGGICGINNNTIDKCVNIGNITAKTDKLSYIGGITGSNYTNCLISDSYSVGAFILYGSDSRYVGAISGNNKGTFKGCYYLSRHYPVGKSGGAYKGEEANGTSSFINYKRVIENRERTDLSLPITNNSTIGISAITMPSAFESTDTSIANVFSKKIIASSKKVGDVLITNNGIDNFSFNQKLSDLSKDTPNLDGKAKKHNIDDVMLTVTVEKENSDEENSYYSVYFVKYEDMKNGVSVRARINEDEYESTSAVSISVILSGCATKMGKYTIDFDSPDVSRFTATDKNYVLLKSGESVNMFMDFTFKMPTHDVEDISVSITYEPEIIKDDTSQSTQIYDSNELNNSDNVNNIPQNINTTQNSDTLAASVKIRENAKTSKYIRSIDMNNFYPDAPITRYDALRALSYIFQIDRVGEFYLSDVSDEYKSTVSKFIGAGIISGYNDSTFRGKNPLSRAEFSKIICIALNLNAKNGDSDFWDLHGHWSEGYVKTLSDSGYVTGYEDLTFHPDNTMSRAEFVVIINRIIGTEITEKEQEYDDLPKSHWAFNQIMNVCF